MSGVDLLAHPVGGNQLIAAGFGLYLSRQLTGMNEEFVNKSVSAMKGLRAFQHQHIRPDGLDITGLDRNLNHRFLDLGNSGPDALPSGTPENKRTAPVLRPGRLWEGSDCGSRLASRARSPERRHNFTSR